LFKFECLQKFSSNCLLKDLTELEA